MTIRKGAAMAACAALLFAAAQTVEPFGAYIAAVKSGEMRPSPVMGTADGKPGPDLLLEEIRSEAEKRRIPPIDAKLDRVWKAIPGLNGEEVDVEATYRLAASAPRGTPIRYVMRELEPKVSLRDLGTHPIYRGNPAKPAAALMINVAWGNEYLTPMLDILDREGVKATFFLDGTWLRNNPELARTIASRGHEMSNHAYSHPDMRKLSRRDAELQISKTETLLRTTLGPGNRWFAPPSGAFNQATVEIAAEQGLQTVLWTVDTVDWRKPPAAAIVAKIDRDAGPGSLILMHPTASARDALAGIIRSLKRKGLQPGTVADTLSPARLPSVEGRAQF